MKTGVELIKAERQRQIKEEGWTSEHDANHINGEIAVAAACYALPENYRQAELLPFSKVPLTWPWDGQYWKPTPQDRIRELVKAGALIAAEIDRLQKVKK